MDYADRLVWSCRDQRDDDQTRLVWADAVGGERGELVVVQCELARGDQSFERVRMLRDREAELLAAHGRAWSGLQGLAKRCVFRRGFVEAAELERVDEATLFAVIGRAPLLDALTVRDEKGTRFGTLFEQPELAHVRALGLETEGRDADDVVARVLESAHTQHLTGLAILARCSDGELEMLLESSLVTRLEQLWVPQLDLAREELVALGARARQLRALRLFSSYDVADVMPAGLRELELGLGYREGWASLASSPAAATLECLRVSDASCEDVERLGDLPRLRALDLGDCQLGFIRNPPSHWKSNLAFAGVPFPALRELSYTRWSRGDEYDALVANLGTQLELLHLPSDFVEPETIPRIAPRVAGRLSTVRSPKWSKAMLTAELGANEPWLYESVIDLA